MRKEAFIRITNFMTPGAGAVDWGNLGWLFKGFIVKISERFFKFLIFLYTE